MSHIESLAQRQNRHIEDYLVTLPAGSDLRGAMEIIVLAWNELQASN